jgi:hypothetical protein
MFVLGPDGTIEDNEVGMNPELADELPPRLEKLLAGQSLHAETLERYAQRLAQYEAAMKAPLPTAGQAHAPPRAEIAPASPPAHHTLEPLWSNADLKQPGNILAIESTDGTERLVINDGWQKVVELDTTGKLIAQHTLKIPATAVVSYLRSARDVQGRRWFVGSASAQQQVHLFDEQFQTVLSYPRDEAEVADVLLCDLDEDGNPEIAAGYWGTRGVESLSLEGVNQWRAGALDNVFRLAPAILAPGEKPKLLAAHVRGSVAVFDAAGQADREIAVDKRFIRAIFAADLNRDGISELCALAPIDAGRDSLLGLDPQGQQLWLHELPAGIHQQPIEQVVAGEVLPGQRCWIACGADGSIYLVAADGTLLDSFRHGAQLTGISTAVIQGQPALVIASTRGVEAYRLARKTP